MKVPGVIVGRMTQTQTAAPSRPSTGARLAVHTEDLVKSFGAMRAVDNICLDVAEGEIFGVLGPNGAGKTTVLRMLATLLEIDSGLAQIFGVDVARSPHVVRQLIGLTGQYASVDEQLTALENLRLFGRLQGLSPAQARATADDLLGQFALEEAATKPLANFSGGMRRRLDLAASLISRPPLIFLDEPTTGLDPRTRGQMWTTIRSLVADGATVLLTTQYLDEADQLADRIAVIDHGRTVAEGTPDELKSSVGVSSLQLDVADAAQSADAARVVEAVLGTDVHHAPEQSRITVALAAADSAGDVLLALRAASIAVASLQVSKPSLDEVFLTLTGNPPAGTQNDPTTTTEQETSR